MSIDDELDIRDQLAYSEGYDEGYADALRQVSQEAARMFRMDETQRARFRWVLNTVQEGAGITL